MPLAILLFSTAVSTKTFGDTGCKATSAFTSLNSSGCFFMPTMVALAPKQRLYNAIFIFLYLLGFLHNVMSQSHLDILVHRVHSRHHCLCHFVHDYECHR